MKQVALLLGLALCGGRAFSQNLPAPISSGDSLAAVKTIDSLLKATVELGRKKEFDKAITTSDAAAQLALAKFGRESAPFGKVCHHRGWVYSTKLDYPIAEKWYLEAVAIREKTLGELNADLNFSLVQLAILYYRTLEYDKSEALYLRILNNRERMTGKEHPDYVQVLNNLGALYAETGEYEKAERTLLEALSIKGRVVGREDYSYAASLDNLASLQRLMGNYEQAEANYQEAIKIKEKTRGIGHTDHVRSVENLAILYWESGNLQKAEQLHLEALSHYEKSLGKEHPEHAYVQGNLAATYLAMGRPEAAGPLFIESMRVKEKALGRDNPEFAQPLTGLGTVQMGAGEYAKAEPLFLEASGILEHKLSRQHPYFTDNLQKLADLYSLSHQPKKAAELLEEIDRTTQERITKGLYHLSERELGDYIHKFSGHQARLLSFAQKAGAEAPAIAQVCFGNALFHKGFLLNAAGHLRGIAAQYPSETERFEQLRSLGRRLASQLSRPTAARDSAAIADIEAKSNDLEKELARTVGGFGEALRQVNWPDVHDRLRPGEAAVEFVSYRFYSKKETDSVMYAALVLREGGQPVFVPLFEEKQLEAAIPDVKNRRAEYANELYSNKADGHNALRDLLWAPLEKHLDGVSKIYFSPAGLLHRINLQAVPFDEKTTLSDRFELVQLGSTRSVALPPPPIFSGKTALLVGGVDYENGNAPPHDNTADLGLRRNGPDFNMADSTLRGSTWKYLPATAAEVVEAGGAMQKNGFSTAALTGAEATETAVKQLGVNGLSPRVLHFATHGYFFPDPSATADGGRRTADGPVFKMSDHPMIRSGLVLAGANRAWRGEQPANGADDGILTAYEISQMDLSGTELVVLSACETGLGDIRGNEGVFGLQRAFKIAGARHLVMSLWQVPDRATQELMGIFYQKWLGEGMELRAAFRAAQAEVRARRPGAFYWAGFVLVE